MYLVYNLLLLIIYPFLLLLALFSKKIRQNLKIRKMAYKAPPAGRPVLWFHAASVGEYEQARVVAQALKKKYPDIFLFFTVYSYSGYSQRQSDPLPDALIALPFDFPWRMKKLLLLIKPRIIVYAKYDVWPNLARLAAKAQIPQYLISATLPAQSYRRNTIARAFFRKVYRYLNGIFAIHPEHTARFAEYGLTAITAGDTRFEAAAERIKRCPPTIAAIMAALRRAIPKDLQVLTAGSTYVTSERLLAELLARHPSLFVIMAPHHVDPQHIKQIDELLQEKNINYQKYTSLTPPKINFEKNTRLLLVDTTGVLPYLYGLADVAYVGGGFEGSLHSVLEPAYFSLPVITGPAIANSQEALDLRNLNLLQVLDSPEAGALLEFCLKYRNNKERIKTSRQIARYYRSRLGATKILLPVLEQAAQLVPAHRKAPQKKALAPRKKF